MKKSPFIALGLLLPIVVLALDYSDATSQYKDGPFSTADSAGISLLTHLDVLQGNSDGQFLPRRTLNRAEFVKIAILLDDQKNGTSVSSALTDRCFPDVAPSAWYASYVCAAKARGIIAGYPDGLFHADRSINYVEAVKVLVNTFGYDVQKQTGDQWYTPYLRAAHTQKTALPETVAPDAFITRGQMARLAAAFEAESKGELNLYRQAEKGVVPSSSLSSSSVVSVGSSSSAVSSNASASSVSSASSNLPNAAFPARSHFLLLGQRSQPIATGNYFPDLEPVRVQSTTVKLRNKIDSISAMYLVDSLGTQVGQLTLDSNDSHDLTWKGSFPTGSSAYVIPQKTSRDLAIVVLLNDRDHGGYGGEIVEVTSWSLAGEGVWSGQSYAPSVADFTFPKHNTAQATITNIYNAQLGTDALTPGSNQVVGAFTVVGTSISPAKVKVEEMDFQVGKSDTVTVTNWQLGSMDGTDLVNCTTSDTTVSCGSLPDGIGTLQDGKRTLRLYATVSVAPNASNPYLQVSLAKAGTPSDGGSVQWTDGQGHYNWVELDSPIAKGTLWK